MTLRKLRKLAALHGVPEHIRHAHLTPKPFLQACNSWLQDNRDTDARLAFMRATKQTIPRGIPKRGHKKLVVAPYRDAHKDRHWREVRQALYNYVYESSPSGPKMRYGHLKRVADYIGCQSSQVHRWICPVCEHDAEPSFSIGMVIVEFLDAHT